MRFTFRGCMVSRNSCFKEAIAEDNNLFFCFLFFLSSRSRLRIKLLTNKSGRML